MLSPMMYVYAGRPFADTNWSHTAAVLVGRQPRHDCHVLAVAARRPRIPAFDEVLPVRWRVDLQFDVLIAVRVHHEPAVPVVRHLDLVVHPADAPEVDSRAGQRLQRRVAECEACCGFRAIVTGAGMGRSTVCEGVASLESPAVSPSSHAVPMVTTNSVAASNRSIGALPCRTDGFATIHAATGQHRHQYCAILCAAHSVTCFRHHRLGTRGQKNLHDCGARRRCRPAPARTDRLPDRDGEEPWNGMPWRVP